MSRKFKRPIESYGLTRYKPMAIELDGAGLGRYRDLADNPIYYYNAIQYAGGGFYRAALGYEVIWDRKAEGVLDLCLDYVLTKVDRDNAYYLDELEIAKDVQLHGVIWPRGVAPQNLSFAIQWPLDLTAGEKLTVRVNLLDKPHHVDLERSNGEVFTISFLRYQNYLSMGMFKKKGRRRNERAKAPAISIKGRTGPRLSLVGGSRKEKPAITLPDIVSGLRKRL